MAQDKSSRRLRIKTRFKNTIVGTSERPRLSVFRSNKQIYAQLIDDESGRTVASASSLLDKKAKGTKIEQAQLVGKEIAEKAKKAKISRAVFDRNGYLYHGRVKSLAESARENGLTI
ncbi:MAG: 50S ribosomal protein L18 [Flavobacteriales bacterium]|nr:50S ribosomal protein L18 [Flavobacteriales bacterium]